MSLREYHKILDGIDNSNIDSAICIPAGKKWQQNDRDIDPAYE